MLVPGFLGHLGSSYTHVMEVMGGRWVLKFVGRLLLDIATIYLSTPMTWLECFNPLYNINISQHSPSRDIGLFVIYIYLSMVFVIATSTLTLTKLSLGVGHTGPNCSTIWLPPRPQIPHLVSCHVSLMWIHKVSDLSNQRDLQENHPRVP
jgi:hypothetical protein